VTNDTIDSSYYYTGENPLGRSTVVTTEVTDADAHAWVEVYIHDFGWFPVEFTVPDYGGEDNSYSDFMNSLTRLFRPMDIGESDAGTDSGLNAPSFNAKSFLNLKNTPAFAVFVWILIVLLLIPIVKRSVKLYSESRVRARARARGDHLPTLIYAYRKASDRLRKMYHVHEPDRIERTYELMKNVLIGHYPVMPTNMTPVSVIRRSIVRFRVRRMGKRMSSYLNKKNISLNELRDLTQLYIYSTQKPSKKEADALICFYKSI
jgi:hypothetical protein